jgi:acyl transferase domain-containing protein
VGVNERGMDIAVVGLSGRFPGARTVDEFWRNLRDGVESITFLSDEELDDGIDPAVRNHPDYVKAAAILDDVDMFDAGFFGYSAREAAILDPQQRMFLECAWEALESAGHTPGGFGGSIGVYVGAGANASTYYMSNLARGGVVTISAENFDLVVANDKDFLGNRVSYKLDLTGPAITVQTACSTSLVAVHLACQSLLGYECDMALAGGSSMRIPQRSGHLYQEGMIFSADGHSRPFDAGANGAVFGSGMGVVVLRRLEDALADRDPVQAVIRGSAVGNDGARKISYVAPSVHGQARAISEALAVSGVDPHTVTAVEAHGTSTPTGDPIEVAALTSVYGATGRTGYCALGSVKGNVGHLDSAAGVTGLIKAVLQARHGELVPTINHTKPNPDIDFAHSPFTVNTELRPWTTDGFPRRIGVSAFGVGGTNAHVIVEEPPSARPSTAGRPVQLVPLSARTAEALDAASANLAAELRANPSRDLADVAYTLQVGREAMRHRRVLVARDAAGAAGLLERLGPPRRVRGAVADGRPRVGFLFTGQGSQYPDMAREVYGTEPVFRERLDACAALLEPELGFDLRTVLHPGDDPAAVEIARARLRETSVAQPALFAVEYALAELWKSWGVEPDAMIGHSLGEITAAAVAGVFTLEDALRLVAVRGRLMQDTEPGAMLSVPLPETRVRELLPAGLSVAAVNAPDSCVVSGPDGAVARFRDALDARDVAGRPLHVRQAFHSALMDPVLGPFGAELEGLSFGAPRVPFVSNATADWIRPDQAADPGYWCSHIRGTVRFGEGVRRLVEDGEGPVVLLEIGPGRALASLAGTSAGAAAVLPCLPDAKDTQPAAEVLLMAAGRLWAHGVDLDWRGLHSGEERSRVCLPTYPFQRQRYWVEADRGRLVPRHGEPAAGARESAPAVLIPRPDLPTDYVAPRTEWERRITTIWQELLGIEAMGVRDVFHDLGAESLISMRVRERIKEKHGVGVPLRDLLQTSTAEELAELVERVTGAQEAESA